MVSRIANNLAYIKPAIARDKRHYASSSKTLYRILHDDCFATVGKAVSRTVHIMRHG